MWKKQLNNICCNLNCKNSDNPAPAFVYSTTYWLGNAASSNSIWKIQSNGNIYTCGFRYGAGDIYGNKIRPVITISKEEID